MPTTAQATEALARLNLGLHLVEMFAAEASDRKAPTEIRLFRRGTNDTEYGPLLFDELAAQTVMRRFADRGVDVCIDYDHDSFAPFGTISGQRPAAGWCKPEVRDGELWVRVLSWTEKARGLIESGEYRYFSPTVELDPDSKRVSCLLALAICNVPATHAIDALVAASVSLNQNPSKETRMDPKDTQIAELTSKLSDATAKLAAADDQLKAARSQNALVSLATTVGLASTASLEEVRTAAAGALTFRKEVLSLTGKDSDAAALGALNALKEKAAEVDDLRQKVDAANTAQLKAEFKSYLDELSTKGKDGRMLPPAKREKAEKMAVSLSGGKLSREGIEMAKEYVAEMLVTATSDGDDDAEKQPAAGGKVSGGQARMLSKMGSDPKKFADWKAKKAAEGTL